MTTEELNELAAKLMVLAKQNLIDDGDLMPIVILIVNGQIDKVIGLQFDRNTKRPAYREVEKMIAETKPEALLLINDAYVKNVAFADEATLQRCMKHGISKEPDRGEAIMVTISPRFGGDSALQQRYHHEDEAIIWDGEPQYLDGFENNLLPEVWKRRPSKAEAVMN